MTESIRGLMIILDGLGDRPCPELNDKTPLEAASTPNLDALVQRGLCGLVDPLLPGLPVGTDTGVSALMGLPVPDGLISRGPIEAAGVGMQLNPGDVALRCNLATVTSADGSLTLLDRRAGRINEGTEELALSLTREFTRHNGIRAVVKEATSHRAVLQLIGEGLSGAVTDVDPGAGWESCGVLASRPMDAGDPAATRTADAINRFVEQSFEILDDHPINQQRRQRGLPVANLLLPRRAGQMSQVRSVVGALGLNAAVVAGECTLAGLARLLDMRWLREDTFTGDGNTDLAAKARIAIEALQQHDLVFVHVKAPDLYAHDGDAKGKKAFIEKIDSAFAELLAQPVAIAVCADHSTPCATGRHSGDPVPAILSAPGGRRDRCEHYSELECMRGGLGRITASALIGSLLDQMNVTHNYRPNERRLFGLAGNL